MNTLNEVDWDSIPAPEDDGRAAHLTGTTIPPVSLAATNGSWVDLSGLDGLAVIYVYPMTGRPGTALPDGWDAIPGARGCTPQSCAFRDHFAELRNLSVRHLFGLSVQDTTLGTTIGNPKRFGTKRTPLVCFGHVGPNG